MSKQNAERAEDAKTHDAAADQSNAVILSTYMIQDYLKDSTPVPRTYTNEINTSGGFPRLDLDASDKRNTDMATSVNRSKGAGETEIAAEVKHERTLNGWISEGFSVSSLIENTPEGYKGRDGGIKGSAEVNLSTNWLKQWISDNNASMDATVNRGGGIPRANYTGGEQVPLLVDGKVTYDRFGHVRQTMLENSGANCTSRKLNNGGSETSCAFRVDGIKSVTDAFMISKFDSNKRLEGTRMIYRGDGNVKGIVELDYYRTRGKGQPNQVTSIIGRVQDQRQ